MTIEFYGTEKKRYRAVLLFLYSFKQFTLGFGLFKGLAHFKKDKKELVLSLNVRYSRRQGHSSLSYCSGNGPTAIFPRLPPSLSAFQPITMSDLLSSSSLLHSLTLAFLTLPRLHTAHSLLSRGHALINTSGLMRFSTF